MARLRLLLACIVMFAIPLQGFAAAAMLCGIEAGHHPAQRSAADGAMRTFLHQWPAVFSHHSVTTHDHRTHAQTQPADARMDTGKMKVIDGVQAKSPTGSPGHQCGGCVSCCHSVALPEVVYPIAITQIPHADFAEPFAFLHTRPAQVPDKPPRA